MDLESGCLLWPKSDGPIASYGTLEGDLTTEVAIIGGGITGAFAAYFLSRAGVATALFDRREIGHGSTAASTGLLQYEIDKSLVDLARLIGHDDAVRAYLACTAALARMKAVVSDLSCDCGLIPRPSLYLASQVSDAPLLSEEYAARRSCRIAVEFLSEGAVRQRFGFRRPAALCSPAALEVDPYRLAHFLIRRASDNGLLAFSQTRVIDCAPDATGATLKTSAGHRVRARMVLLATGYEAPPFIDLSGVSLKSTYALASVRVEDFRGWPQRCLIWETARPYFYARTTSDDRVIVGGGDEQFVDPERRDAVIRDKSIALVRQARALFPEIDIEPACCWAGTFAETRDGLPLIGPCRHCPHVYVALGYGGNGITFSLLAGEIIRDLYTDHSNSQADLFRLDRKSLE